MDTGFEAGYTAVSGDPERLGAYRREDGVNFAFVVPEERRAQLVLTDREGRPLTEIELPAEERFGDVSAVLVRGVVPNQQVCGYYYKVEKRKVLDPCALLIDKGICRFVDDSYDWGDDAGPGLRPEELSIYKLHVRGFSKKAKIAAPLRGTYAGLSELLPYIRDLGFRAVELLPAYEWVDRPRIQSFPPAGGSRPGGADHAVRHSNYWGYAEDNYYFAPRAAYAAGGNPVTEFKDMVRSAHALGMELYMELYYPPGTDPCLARDTVRFWKREYHVDGFHFVGQGVPFDIIAGDPLLSRTKLMFEYIDDGIGYHGHSKKFRNLFLYNDAFEHTGRAFLKGDDGRTGEFAQNLRRNPPGMCIVNYMANVNGFTLFDSVCFNERHNEENGEENRDGTNLNYSWNCGTEGPSRRKAVRELRMKQVKNALTYVFLGQGIPLLYAGDEQLNSQEGNNNAWCCDNTVGWVNWKTTADAEEIRGYVKDLLGFRNRHPVFRMPAEFRGTDYRSYGNPDISFHDNRAWMCSFENTSHSLAVMYNGLYTQGETAGKGDSLFYVAYNAWWNPYRFAVPPAPAGYRWGICADTSLPGSPFAVKQGAPKEEKYLTVGPRSVCILEAGPVEPEKTEPGQEGNAPAEPVGEGSEETEPGQEEHALTEEGPAGDGTEEEGQAT